ncbi:hypothetical protein TNCV_4903841 [Trichonephila clavipes]|nr:hypothetical protein TNCV_4903841 [Trichonephila clavipes]
MNNLCICVASFVSDIGVEIIAMDYNGQPSILLNMLRIIEILRLVQSILNSLEDCDIPFSYVRGHSGNLGNGREDQLAKEATCQDVNLPMFVPLSNWKHLAWERTVSTWNTKFLALPKALWNKNIFPTIYQRLK